MPQNIVWTETVDQVTAKYLDCKIDLVLESISNKWVALVSMPTKYIFRLPPLSLDKAKIASIDVIELVGSCYQRFVDTLKDA